MEAVVWELRSAISTFINCTFMHFSQCYTTERPFGKSPQMIQWMEYMYNALYSKMPTLSFAQQFFVTYACWLSSLQVLAKEYTQALYTLHIDSVSVLSYNDRLNLVCGSNHWAINAHCMFRWRATWWSFRSDKTEQVIAGFDLFTQRSDSEDPERYFG